MGQGAPQIPADPLVARLRQTRLKPCPRSPAGPLARAHNPKVAGSNPAPRLTSATRAAITESRRLGREWPSAGCRRRSSSAGGRAGPASAASGSGAARRKARTRDFFSRHRDEPCPVMASGFKNGFAHFRAVDPPVAGETAPGNPKPEVTVSVEMLAAPPRVGAIRGPREPAGGTGAGFEQDAVSVVRRATEMDPPSLALTHCRAPERNDHCRDSGEAGPAKRSASRPFGASSPIHAGHPKDRMSRFPPHNRISIREVTIAGLNPLLPRHLLLGSCHRFLSQDLPGRDPMALQAASSKAS